MTAPAIVGYGDLDVPLFADRCRALADRMPRATLHCIDGAAHLVELERPDAVAHLVRDLLRSSPRQADPEAPAGRDPAGPQGTP